MKNLILLFTILFIGSTLMAQEITISEAPRTKDNGTYNSFLFELPDVDKGQALKDWERFMKDFKAKTKYSKKTKIYGSRDVTIPQLSDDKVQVSAKILEDQNPNKKTTVIVWFDLGESYASSELDSAFGEYISTILTEYAMKTSKHHAESVVKVEEKELAGMEKDLKNLIKDKKDYQKAIDKAKEVIAKNEKNLERNMLDQKNKTKEIEAQKETVQEAKSNVASFRD